MCGILGFYNKKEGAIEKEIFLKSTQSLSHRGPDHCDVYFDKNIALGHTRLKIIDLNSTANQPFNHKDKLIITYNGEIYNFKEIKEDLRTKGYQFKTQSDTEVVALSYAEWGTDCFKMFDGMFALGIYDIEKQKIVLGRDIFGKKPLYYHNEQSFMFASEFTPFKFFLDKMPVSKEAINHFLTIGYVLHPLTIYENIKILPPASYLEFNLDTHKISISKYYNYADNFRVSKTRVPEKEIVENISFLLKNAIHKRMVGDVKHGLFLSGGLDSAGIAAIAKKKLNKSLPCYTIAFNKTIYNELGRSKIAVESLNLDQIVVDSSNINQDEFYNYVNKIDYLTFDNSSYPIYNLAKRAKEDVKFVLSGDGSDEIFGGYATYTANELNNRLKSLIPFLKKSGLNRLFYNLTKSSNDKVGLKTKINRFVRGMDTNYRKAHFSWRQIFSNEQRLEIMGNEYKDLIYDTDPFIRFNQLYDEVKDLEFENQHFYIDSQTWLTDNNLIKLDRNTMFAGLEARCPYLDKDLVAFLAKCPVSLKKKKYLLKKAIEDLLPSSFIKKKKVGFNSPVHRWFNIEENEFEFYTKKILQSKYL